MCFQSNTIHFLAVNIYFFCNTEVIITSYTTSGKKKCDKKKKTHQHLQAISYSKSTHDVNIHLDLWKLGGKKEGVHS